MNWYWYRLKNIGIDTHARICHSRLNEENDQKEDGQAAPGQEGFRAVGIVRR